MDTRGRAKINRRVLDVGQHQILPPEQPLILGEPTTLRPERFARSGAAPPPSPAALAAAQALLAEAQRPLIIAGGGARRAGGALRKLVEALDGYLITTVAGKGAVAESHPAALESALAD